MIARTYILENLNALDHRFNKATSAKESLFYSKLAIIELCGWIEESMDDLVLRCARRHLKLAANVKYVEKEIVERTYGFKYEKHFRRMLIQVIGLINIEKLEKRVDQTKRTHFIATLEALTTSRNSEAHTHIRGTTKLINAPSVTLNQFNTLYEGLIEYDNTVRKMHI